jgi:hypothetical protein
VKSVKLPRIFDQSVDVFCEQLLEDVRQEEETAITTKLMKFILGSSLKQLRLVIDENRYQKTCSEELEGSVASFRRAINSFSPQ